MDDLLADAKQLAKELATTGGPEDFQAGLLAALEPFVRTLEADGRPQRPSTETISRYCVEHMDWNSPVYARCVDLVTRAKARL